MADVLVVDDDPAIRRLLRVTLEPVHRVAEASDGADALRRLRRRRPDIVLLDIAMPKIDGLTVCRAVRADPALAHLGLIVVSAFANPEEALAAGADRYFGKPFRPLALLAAVDEVLALRTADAPAAAADKIVAMPARRAPRVRRIILRDS
jgi:CheY-like chemotaxis protein